MDYLFKIHIFCPYFIFPIIHETILITKSLLQLNYIKNYTFRNLFKINQSVSVILFFELSLSLSLSLSIVLINGAFLSVIHIGVKVIKELGRWGVGRWGEGGTFLRTPWLHTVKLIQYLILQCM